MNIISHNVGGFTVRQREIDGYMDATRLCQSGGKKWSGYWRNQGTQEYLEALAIDLNLDVVATNPDVQKRATALVEVFQGGNNKDTQGTWVHPEVAVDVGQWISSHFRIIVNRVFRDWKDSVSNKSQHNPPYWFRRLGLFRSKTKIPVGYWCVFEEIASMIADLEHYGYVPPAGIIPDGSVGKCWCNYLRSLKINPKDIVREYPHYYPDWAHPVNAYIYPLEYLATFRLWFEQTYKPQKMVTYFKKADVSALPSVCKLLGLPEGR